MKSTGSSQEWCAWSTPDQSPHFKVGAKKLSPEDDRKEGRQARRFRARRWVPGCCCGMRSRRTEPSIDAGSDPAQELTPPVTTRTIVVPERLGHERGRSSVPACRPLGGNIRVGLEDSLWMGPGKLAKSNAEQVARARQIVGKAAIV